ncbi:MAG: ATP-dependent helicase, partial [Proteobacteria bacterium]|nr:ATP-dependent helicase [Pseudomonadota bacterium]
GTPPNAILLLTFTRKSAQEMLKRAADLLDNRCEDVSGGTFHSFANYILRRYSRYIGFDSGFNILDRDDSETLIAMVRKEILNTSKHASFPRKQTLANIFSKAANKVLTIENVILNDYIHFEDDMEIITMIYKEYVRRKFLHSYLDYDDLLIRFKTLMEENSDLKDRISSSYEHIMVDEYQDTNKIQADIVCLLTGGNKNIMVVGDDSQSIYAFRGADFKNIIEFPILFPGTRIITLEENYRSDQPILDLTNIIIERASEKYSKILFTKREGGAKPLLIKTSTENGQSVFIVEKINNLVKNNVPLNEIAVLFRAGYYSFDLEIELARNGIPFKKVGGFKFVESAHIKDIIAHMKVISNPKDRVSWQRILLLIDKIGPKTADNIFGEIQKENSGHAGLLTAKIQNIISDNLKRLKDLFGKIDPDIMSVHDMGKEIAKFYLPVLKQKFDDYPKREKDIEQLILIMERYNSLVDFLTDMALEPPNTIIDNSLSENSSGDNHLVLSTIHSAKGLEWHTVFIIWALDGRFPSLYSINNPEELEEELRLMYVAATRAKKNLYFTYPNRVYDKSSGMVLNRPSRFLDLINSSVLSKYSLNTYEYDY